MIVVDGSFVVEMLTNTVLAESLRANLFGSGDSVAVPHLLDIEVVSALRRLVVHGKIAPDRAGELLSELVELPMQRLPHTALVARIWELRHNFTAYDATYIALAEHLGAILYTCDWKLCKGPRARVIFFDKDPSVFGPKSRA